MKKIYYVTKFVFREEKIMYESLAFSLRRRKIMTSSNIFISYFFSLVAIVLHHSFHDSKRAKKKFHFYGLESEKKMKETKVLWNLTMAALSHTKHMLFAKKTHIHRARAVELMTSFFLSHSLFSRIYFFFVCIHSWRFILLSSHHITSHQWVCTFLFEKKSFRRFRHY